METVKNADSNSTLIDKFDRIDRWIYWSSFFVIAWCLVGIYVLNSKIIPSPFIEKRFFLLLLMVAPVIIIRVITPLLLRVIFIRNMYPEANLYLYLNFFQGYSFREGVELEKLSLKKSREKGISLWKHIRGEDEEDLRTFFKSPLVKIFLVVIAGTFLLLRFSPRFLEWITHI